MNNTNNFDEQLLLQRLIDDDEAAFSALYAHYISPIKLFIGKYLKSSELTADIAQEIFIKIWSIRHQLAGVKSFKAYLFITARNYTINTLKLASRSEIVLAEILNNITYQRNVIEDDLQYKEYNAFVKEVFSKLPPRTKEIFELCREQGKSYEDVAKELGISRNAIKKHMVHAMRVLKTATENDLGIPLGVMIIIALKK